jgi:hypothetical protein
MFSYQFEVKRLSCEVRRKFGKDDDNKGLAGSVYFCSNFVEIGIMLLYRYGF